MRNLKKKNKKECEVEEIYRKSNLFENLFCFRVFYPTHPFSSLSQLLTLVDFLFLLTIRKMLDFAFEVGGTFLLLEVDAYRRTK